MAIKTKAREKSYNDSEEEGLNEKDEYWKFNSVSASTQLNCITHFYEENSTLSQQSNDYVNA